jgi:hypothetical protein
LVSGALPLVGLCPKYLRAEPNLAAQPTRRRGKPRLTSGGIAEAKLQFRL